MQYDTISGIQGICPSGWHIPTNIEWDDLAITLGGNDIAAGKMMSTDTQYWNNLNTGATNESKFSAIAGGYRYFHLYENILNIGSWWSSSEGSETASLARIITHDRLDIQTSNSWKYYGYSVRCIKN